MNAHSMVDSISDSLAKKYKGNTKEKRVYHLKDKNDIKMVGIKRKYIGFKKRNRNSISSMYNIKCDPYLSINKAVIRIIPYTRKACIEQLELH